MKHYIGIAMLVVFCGLGCHNHPKTIKDKQTDFKRSSDSNNHPKIIEDRYADFELSYGVAGLGSGMGSMGPAFKVKDTKYIYTNEQNSYYGEPNQKPDTICRGTIRTKSIDSILVLAKSINDTLVYETDASVMSGNLIGLYIHMDSLRRTFRLHNAGNPVAQKIVAILNSNIPKDKGRLWTEEDVWAEEGRVKDTTGGQIWPFHKLKHSHHDQ